MLQRARARDTEHCPAGDETGGEFTGPNADNCGGSGGGGGKKGEGGDKAKSLAHHGKEGAELAAHLRTHPKEYAAYKAALAAAQRKLIEAGQATNILHTVNGDGDTYTSERAREHDKLLAAEEEKRGAGKPREKIAVLMGGAPGAGKTTTLRGQAKNVGIDPKDFAEVGADNFKDAIVEAGLVKSYPDFPPAEGAELIHQESRALTAKFFDRMIAKGYNIALDSTMSSSAPFTERNGYLEKLALAGYKVKMVFVDVKPETSLARVKKRHLDGMGGKHGGRTIPDSAITGPSAVSHKGFNSAARDTFEGVKKHADEWYTFDNDSEEEGADLIDSWDERHKTSKRALDPLLAELRELLEVA